MNYTHIRRYERGSIEIFQRLGYSSKAIGKDFSVSYYIGVASVNIIPMLDPFGEAQDQACKWEKCD